MVNTYKNTINGRFLSSMLENVLFFFTFYIRGNFIQVKYSEFTDPILKDNEQILKYRLPNLK